MTRQRCIDAAMVLLTLACVAVWGLILAPDILPACLEEDGSGQLACYWDASESGNGVGVSYVLVGPLTLYVP